MRTVYKALCVDLLGISRVERLSPKFRALNDKAHANNRLSPTTVVFGVYQKLHGARDLGMSIQNAEEIRDCTAIVACMKVHQTVQNSAKVRNTPYRTEIERV